MGANNLEEFLNENMHRSYPIMDGADASDVSGTYNIPTELIADMRIVIPEGYKNTGTFFISSIVVRRYTVDIELSYRPDDTGIVTVVGNFFNISTSDTLFAEYNLIPEEQPDPLSTLSDITGSVIAGVGTAAATLPGEWVFSYSATPIVPTVVVEQLTKFRSVQVGDTIYTGNIILKEGPNVSINTTFDPSSDTTTLTFSATTPESTVEAPLVDDNSLIERLVSIYGPPITRINGLSPVDGNFNIKGADCINITNDGTSGVIMNNPCGKPCCDEGSYLTPVYESLNQLNARHVRLETFLQSTVNNTDTLLSRLGDMENAIGAGGF